MLLLLNHLLVSRGEAGILLLLLGHLLVLCQRHSLRLGVRLMPGLGEHLLRELEARAHHLHLDIFIVFGVDRALFLRLARQACPELLILGISGVDCLFF